MTDIVMTCHGCHKSYYVQIDYKIPTKCDFCGHSTLSHRDARLYDFRNEDNNVRADN